MTAATTPVNPIAATIDFDRDGVQHGYLKLPHSDDSSAWGAIMIPITQVKHGDGPTALLSGGNHGDEYEGPIALTKLAHELPANDVTGRVIILPAMNYPAFEAARRVSPIDGGNLNRAFPGKPDGTATQKIADYVTTRLLPLADLVMDIHSGGKTLEFVPFAAMHRTDDAARDAACEACMMAFGAPYAMYMTEMDPAGLYDTVAEAQGKIFVTTELGGGGSATPATIAIAETGIANVLRHAGIVKGAPAAPGPCQVLDMSGDGAFITATDGGLLEPCVGLGDPVQAGDPIARIWSAAHPDRPPQVYTAAIDGIVAGRHFPSIIRPGDCLAVIAGLA